jgi:rhodanese family protein
MKNITPAEAQALRASGATLADIRSADEYAREHIAGAQRVEVAALQAEQFTAPVIFHCRLGQRTRQQAARLRASVRADVAAYLLDGGIEAWKQAGLPVIRDCRQPLELQRQVHIAAGSLIVLGALLGATVSPWFYGLCALVGAGLIFAGVSGFCGMAVLLAKMPWNRRASS